jgi:hypothetical protein
MILAGKHEQINDHFPPYALAEKAKKDPMKSAVRVADLLVDTVDGGVQELYVNEKRIELEARALFGTNARYRRQTDQWLSATNEINSVLKVPDPCSTGSPQTSLIYILLIRGVCFGSSSAT